MMGRPKSEQAQLFYQFDLNDAVPEDYLVRKIDGALDLSWLCGELAPRLRGLLGVPLRRWCVYRPAFSFFVRVRNLGAAHLLSIQRRNREAGSRLRRPRGAMPERLFLWNSGVLV
jgi:hypothetical protein